MTGDNEHNRRVRWPRSTAWLTGHGRLPWTQAREHLHGAECLWMDLDGIHLAPAPVDPPPASHLWAWTNPQAGPERRLLRVRLDLAEAIVAQLDLDADPRFPGAEQVEVSEETASGWPPGEGRVSVAPEWRGLTIRVTTVHGLMPLAFARVIGARGQAAAERAG